MNARYYVPYIYRMLTPDSIVPDPANPQSYNRYSYVNNRPTVFSDPTGHCAAEGIGREGECTPVAPPAPPLPDVYTLPILDVIYFHAVIMPDGAVVNVNSDQVVTPFNADPDTVNLILNEVGVALDALELVLIWLPPSPQTATINGVVSLADTSVEVLACYTGGECYYDQPYRGLPKMAVVNQDVLINALDNALPPAMERYLHIPEKGTDTATTFISMFYDHFDAAPGIVPNKFSLGVALNTDLADPNFGLHLYLLLYPNPKTTISEDSPMWGAYSD